MTSSMTAFSRQQSSEDWGTLVWEIRSVNHRYLEPHVRLPEMFKGLENTVRETLRKHINRGKVECQLRYQASDAQASDMELDNDLLNQLVRANQQIAEAAGLEATLSSIDLLKWPGVVKEPELDLAPREKQAMDLFLRALDDLIASREREGAELEGFLLQRVAAVREIVVSVRANMPQILANQKQNLVDRLADMQAELEPARLEQEIALLAQKADVDEELDRLNSHLNEVERVIKANEQKGRRLDFLMQELNREANTLSSKSVVAETTLNAVELKVLIEQMREQVQNIE